MTVLDLTYLAILMKNGVKNTQFQIKAKLEMGGSNDLAGCLELLEDQGFKAEHQLLIKLFSCINDYCKQEKMRNVSSPSPPCETENIGENQNTFGTAARISIEEGEIDLKNEAISSNSKPDLLETSDKLQCEEYLYGIKDEAKHLPQSDTASPELAADSKQSKTLEFQDKSKGQTLDCKYCSFKLIGTEKRRMFKYQLRKHNKTRHHVCEICHLKNADKNELEIHMKNDHEDREGKLICGIKGCSKSPRGSSKDLLLELMVHVRRVHDKIPYICRKCNKPFLYFTRHKLLHHSVDPKTLHTCGECEYICTTEKYMRVHKRLVHSTSKPENVIKPKKILPCDLCNFKTTGISNEEEFRLMVHKSTHQDDDHITCDFCPYKSTKRFTLKKHLAEEHGMGKVLYCNFCTYKTGGHSGEGHMKNHIAGHSKEKLFLCDKCEFSGRTNESLRTHMQRHDQTTPKYLCDECEYKSSDRGNFIAHRTVKHGSLVLPCAQCDYKTKSKRSLREHSKKHAISLKDPSYLDELLLTTHGTK